MSIAGGNDFMKWITEEPPLMIQKDLTVWLAADHPEAEEARGMLTRFADLIKSPGHLHLYRITQLSLWNAASAGMEPESICRFLHANSRLGLAQTVRTEIRRTMERYGLLKLAAGEDGELLLHAADEETMDLIRTSSSVGRFLTGYRDGVTAEVIPGERGRIKQELIRLGYPVEDQAGFLPGEPLPVRLKEKLPSGAPFKLREYQQQAVLAFRRGGFTGGSGVLVLPCGAGKTVVGLAVMEHYRSETLILAPNVTSVRQWKRELLDKTNLDPSLVGEYSGETKEVRPVTIATYQILTHKNTKDGPPEHMELFIRRNWGLIIYDEVHLLPAPVFRMTAELQAKRRLGLTATLIREDGNEADVFSLVGPKRYEAQWKRLEDEGWLAKVRCLEIRVPFGVRDAERYAAAGSRDRIRIAGENACKLEWIDRILQRHAGGQDRVLIIGQYLDQLRAVSARTGAPMISGEMKQEKRERLFQAFREGSLTCLVVSKVANFAVDLPDASVAVQISGSFGSRQEEAQRLGRILRPKRSGQEAVFYTLVTGDSKEQDFALNRRLFLLEHGYRYDILNQKENAEGVWNADREAGASAAVGIFREGMEV